MSWQSYVDDQLLATKCVSEAVICGHDGNVWACSKDAKVSPNELKDLISKFNDIDKMASTGITLAGIKYMYLSSNDKVVRAKKLQSGIHVIKTTQAYIVCIYHEPIVAEQAATVTEKLGDYLISVGY